MIIRKMKPCPFCGGEAALKDRHLLAEEIRRGGLVMPMVFCLNPRCCGSAGPMLMEKDWKGMSYEDIEQYAINAWNNRAEVSNDA